MKHKKQEITILVSTHAVTDFYGGFLMPLLPGLCERFGISPFQGAALAALYVILMNFPQPLFGHVMQPRWHQTYFWIGPILSSVVCTMGIVGSAAWLVPILAIGALAMALYHPEAIGKAHALVKGRGHSLVSLMFLGGYSGHALGKIASTATISLGRRLTRQTQPGSGFEFLLVWIPLGVLCGILAWKHRRRFSTEVTPEKPVRLASPSAPKGEKRRFLLLFACAALITSTVTLAGLALPFYYQQRMEDYLLFSGFATFLFGFCGSLGGLGLARLAERTKPSKVLRWAYLPAAPLLAALTYIPPVQTLWVLPFAGAACTAAFPVLVAIGQRFQRIGSGFSAGAMVGVTWGIGGLALLPAGSLIETVGPTAVLRLLCFVPLVTLVLLQVLVSLKLPGEE